MITLDSNDADAYFDRGNTYAKQGKNKSARTDFEKAKSLFADRDNISKVREINNILKRMTQN